MPARMTEAPLLRPRRARSAGPTRCFRVKPKRKRREVSLPPHSCRLAAFRGRRARALEPEAVAVEAAPGTYPSPGSPSRPGTSASRVAAEEAAAEAVAAVEAERPLPVRNCRSGWQ